MALVKFSGTVNFIKLLIQQNRSPTWLDVLWGTPAGHLSELGHV